MAPPNRPIKESREVFVVPVADVYSTILAILQKTQSEDVTIEALKVLRLTMSARSGRLNEGES